MSIWWQVVLLVALVLLLVALVLLLVTLTLSGVAAFIAWQEVVARWIERREEKKQIRTAMDE